TQEKYQMYLYTLVILCLLHYFHLFNFFFLNIVFNSSFHLMLKIYFLDAPIFYYLKVGKTPSLKCVVSSWTIMN
ncbi:hypothetical protein L9F63_004326, partial [Diploptera punctata]